MTTGSVNEIATPDLVTETRASGKRIDVRFVGCAEPIVSEDLASYLSALHHAAISASVEEIVVDVRSLEFVSAAGVRALLLWVTDLRSGGTYVVRFVVDAKLAWQRRTLGSLESFAGTCVRIE